MEYFIIYLVIGLVVSFAISEVDKTKVDDEDINSLNNIDRILYIIIWPLMIFWIIRGLLNLTRN